MKRLYVFSILIVLMCIILTSCGEEKTENVESENKEEVKKLVEDNQEESVEGVSLSTITSDAAKQSELVAQNIEITNLEIIKRQTNIDDKEDIIYVHVEGENSDFKAVRNYKLIYILYNEGWILETNELYTDENNKNENIPLHSADMEIVEKTFNDYNFCKPNFNIVEVVESEIEIVEQDTYHEVYKKEVTCKYDYFTDNIEMFVVCDWVDTCWLTSVDYNNSLCLNENTYGSYGASSYNQYFNTSNTINVEIYKNDETACYSVSCETNDNWGTSYVTGQGACELCYHDASLSTLTGLSGTYVLINTEEDYTLTIFPDGIYFGNILLDRK